MGRKLFPPFNEEPGVPESAWVDLMLKMPTVFEAVWKLYAEYRKIAGDWEHYSRAQRDRVKKRWLRSPESKALIAVIQLEFNYSESTFKTAEPVRRAMLFYWKHRDKILKERNIRRSNPADLVSDSHASTPTADPYSV